MDVYQGGSRGSVEESKVTAAWPEYEADYLKRRLMTGVGKWDAEDLNDAQRAVYLQEVAKHHETEADECLKRDFKLWLEGRHPTYNDATRAYTGDAERRHVYRTSDGANLVTLPMDDWRSTPWGTDQLTHLPGVRNFLRNEFEEGEKQTLHMNLLAEHGPQTLEEAWMYFKHWVAERPLSEAQCDIAVDPGRGPIGDFGNKALFGSMPHHMRNEGARAAPPGGGAPPSSRGFTNFGSGTASAGPTPMDTSAPTPPSPQMKTEPPASQSSASSSRDRQTGRQADIQGLQGNSKNIAQEQATTRAASARRNFINQARRLAEAEMRGEASAAQLRTDLAQANEYWKNAQRAAAESQDATRFAEATAAARVQQDSAFRDRSRVGRAAQTEQRARQMRADLESAGVSADAQALDEVRLTEGGKRRTGVRRSDVEGYARGVRAKSPGRSRAEAEEVDELARRFARASAGETSRRIAREGPNPADNQMRD